jgi:hypothetical protein
MSSRRRDDLLTAVALTRFSQQFEDADPEFADRAWQLAADRLVAWDVDPGDVVDELWNE